MKRIRIVACSTLAGFLLAAAPGFAQVSEDGMGKVVPVELYACNYVDGKGGAELDAVIAQWNAYADDTGMDDYAAWLLSPFFFTPEQEFDILWLGAFRDGNAMGEGLHNWITRGGEVAAAFAEVVDCTAHVGFSSAMYKAPPSGNVPETGVITMMNCELNEGNRYTDIKAAELKWAAHLDESGSDAAFYHWMPIYGGGDAEFDYKVVFAYPDFKELGANFENYANGGGREKSTEIFGDIDECDDARVYISKNIRSGKIRD